MGVVVVLFLWTVIGLVVATIGAAVLACATAILTRRVITGRRRTIIAAAIFPFVCLAWAGVLFVFQAVVNEGFLHRDLGIADTWHAPLPNGYQVLMIDVTDHGWVYNPKTQELSGISERDDAMSGVRHLQVTGRYILGAADSNLSETNANAVNIYFILDTQVGKRTEFNDFYSLQLRARTLGIEPKLEPINEVYSKFRFTWFDVFVGVLFCVPPALGILLLAFWILRLRRTRPAV